MIVFDIRYLSYTLIHLGIELFCLESGEFMIASREMVSLSTQANKLCENNTYENSLAEYTKISW